MCTSTYVRNERTYEQTYFLFNEEGKQQIKKPPNPVQRPTSAPSISSSCSAPKTYRYIIPPRETSSPHRAATHSNWCTKRSAQPTATDQPAHLMRTPCGGSSSSLGLAPNTLVLTRNNKKRCKATCCISLPLNLFAPLRTTKKKKHCNFNPPAIIRFSTPPYSHPSQHQTSADPPHPPINICPRPRCPSFLILSLAASTMKNKRDSQGTI